MARRASSVSRKRRSARAAGVEASPGSPELRGGAGRAGEKPRGRPPAAVRSALVVNTKTQRRKSSSRPPFSSALWAVQRPSSRMDMKTFSTSGWAFSSSSNMKTVQGLSRTASKMGWSS